MTDNEFVTAVEACSVSGRDFRHADHVRLAWIYLGNHSLIDAILERYYAPHTLHSEFARRFVLPHRAISPGPVHPAVD